MPVPKRNAYAGNGDYQLPYCNSWGVGERKSCPENMSVKGYGWLCKQKKNILSVFLKTFS